MESNKRTLLGTIGYHLLSNHSIGPLLFDKLNELEWAKAIDVQEMNWGPIAVVQMFETNPNPYERIVFLTAIEREDRSIGDYNIYKWGARMPSDEDIQACVGDAVTGVISPENLLIIGEHFKIWPDEVYLFDVEPGPEKPGITLTTEVGVRVPEYFDAIRELCLQGIQNIEKYEMVYGDEAMERNLSKK